MGFSVQPHGPSAGLMAASGQNACSTRNVCRERGNTEGSLADRGGPHWGPLYLVPAELHIGPVGSGLQAGVCKLQVHHLSTQVVLQAPNVCLQVRYLF